MVLTSLLDFCFDGGESKYSKHHSDVNNVCQTKQE